MPIVHSRWDLFSVSLIDANDGFVQWLRYDGALLISGSLAESPPRSSASLTIRERIAVREQGDFEHTLANRRFLESYRASSRYPVVVVVALDREEILASWIVEAKRLTAIVVPILVALTGALMLIWRRRQHIEAQGLEMERTRKLSASVFDASSDAIVLTKPDGEIISVNSAFERITGYTHPEAIGRNPRFLASGMQDRSFYKRLWDTLLAEGHWQGEIVNRKKNGELYTGWLTIDAVKDEKATLLHFVGVTTDITDRKRYEAELLEAKVKAEAGALAKTTFLATMSHEIRTPMNGILGMSELLLLTDLNSEQREQLSTIQSSAEALLSILNEILDFSRIEAQGVSVERVRFDPLRIVTDIVGLFGPRAEEKNLALRQQINGEYPHAVVGDPTRLRQILTNLVSNAVKFTQEGSITLTASADAGDRIESSTGDHDIYLNFLVKDTGIGIANDKQQVIFEPFSQADTSTTRSYGGTGLGLTISRKIATALGGTLTLVSTPGQGSEFHLRIKTKAVQTRESEIDRRETNRRHVVRRPAGSLNILVAEDTLTNQKVIRAMLAKLGHEVHVVDDGAAAVEIARQRNFDVILMDMQMPVMSGLEATRAIRAENSKSGRHVRIIALTANAYDSDREACLAAGMNDFLSKPVALDALQEALAKHDRRMG